jgi:general secretion pathway protein M
MLTTPWISRLVAILLVAVVAVAGYILLVEPIVDAYVEVDQAIANARERLEHFERLGATRPALAAQMAELERRHSSQGYYLSGGTDALAAAALQDRLKQVVEANGTTIRSIQPLPGADEEGFRRVTVRAQMTATTESLFRSVYTLEAGAPLVFIDNIDIQSRLARRAADAAGDSGLLEEPVLTVGFDVYGYLPLEAK